MDAVAEKPSRVATRLFDILPPMSSVEADPMPEEGQASDDPMIGQIIDGRYRIDSILGEGGMGAVYVAQHLRLDKPVALKVIRAEVAGREDVVARFTREAMVTAKLDHPNIASAMDCGELPDGGAFLVIQLVRGQSLDEVMSAGAMPWSEACRIGEQIADALVAAHAQGIIHRDLKPDNVLLESRDDGSYLAKVLDFGIARLNDPASSSGPEDVGLTRAGTVIGTPGYMSPEQATGGQVDERADLYALGVILWECVAGERLWKARTLTELFGQQLTQQPPPPLRVGLPEDLTTVIAELLATSTKDRPADASVIRDRLRMLIASAPDQTGTSVPLGMVAAGIASSTQSSNPASTWMTAVRSGTGVVAEAVRESSSGQARPVFLGLLVLLVVIVGGWFLWSGEEPASTSKPGSVASSSSKSSSSGEKANDAGDDVADDGPQQAGVGVHLATVPADLAEPLETLMKARRSRDRDRAAKFLLEYEDEDEVPEFARLSARLELAKTCENKQEVLLEIESHADPRALPVTRRLRDSPKRGCGSLFRRSDCWKCLRSDVDRITKMFEQVENVVENIQHIKIKKPKKGKGKKKRKR